MKRVLTIAMLFLSLAGCVTKPTTIGQPDIFEPRGPLNFPTATPIPSK